MKGKTDLQKKSVIDEEIAANACFTVLSNKDNFTALVKQNRSLAEKVRDFFADFIEKIKNALTRLAKNNAEYRALQNDTEAKEKILAMFNKALESSNTNLNKSNEVKFSKVGKTDDGRTIYKTNYETHTPKAVKQQDIINLVQNVWSRLPIELNIVKNGKTVPILARFNPNLSERSDLSKIAFGNRKGNASEKRMTLDLASDLYSIAEEAQYVKSKAETGKNNPAHKNVSQWHYFITNLVYRDENNQDIDCYMNIDVKETNEGNWFYSFAIEKGTAPQTLLAVVTDETSATVPINSISNSNENVKYSLKTDSDGNELSEQQQEYFKDSKVRDEDGHLLVMYHGTPNAGFTRFRSGSYFTQNRNYADRYQYPGASSLSVKTTENNPNTYKVYLNIKKPFDTRNPAEREIFENEFFMKWGNGSPLSDRGLPDWVEAMDLQEFIEENGYDYDGLILDEGADGGYGMPVVDRGISFVTFNSNQVKNIDNKNPTDDDDIRFSMKETSDYSYESLVSKPDMPVTVINDQKDYTPGKSTRENVVDEAQRSALSVGRKDSSGNVYVYVNDTDTEVMLSKRGLRHSLDRRLSIIAPVTENIGPIIKNSIRINELSPEFETIKNSYVLIGIAKNQKNEPYVVSFVVNRALNEVMSVDVLYAVNAKKEATALIEPELSSQSDVSLTASTISISDLLDYVNRYYPDILPEDVLRHYGYTARPDGVIGESALYSLKEEDNTSVFEDNEELAESAEDVQNMLRLVSTENNELRKAFDIRTVRQAEDSSVAKVAAYLRKQYDRSYKIQAAQTSNLLSYYVYLFCSGR